MEQKCSKCKKDLPLDFNYKTCDNCRSVSKKCREKNKAKYSQNRKINYNPQKAKESYDKTIIMHLFSGAKIRSKKLEFNITKEYIKTLFPKDNICQIRNVIMHTGDLNNKDDSFSLDRINNNLGYIIGNVQIISNKANRIKYNATLTELELFYKLFPPIQHNIDNQTLSIIINDRINSISNLMNYKKKYLTLNLEKMLLENAKKRSKENNLPFNIDENYIKSIFPLDNNCPIFGTKFIRNDYYARASLDRIVPELGYVKDNIIILSNRANMIKSDCSIQELFSIIDSFRKLYDSTKSGIIL